MLILSSLSLDTNWIYEWYPKLENWRYKIFHSTYYQPKNAIVIVAGDIDEKWSICKCWKAFWKILKIQRYSNWYSYNRTSTGWRKKSCYKKDSAVEMLAITYHIPNFEHEDQVTLSAI